MKIAIIQPLIPHYREDFFRFLNRKVSLEIFCYEESKKIESDKFKKGSFRNNYLKNIKFGPFLLYNIFKVLNKKYSVLVLMLHFGHLSTWILLFTKKIHGKKIILWGQGISVKRYLKEEIKPNVLLKLMIFLSDGVWFYTDKELSQWEKIFPKKKMFSLNNTISEAKTILERNVGNKIELKEKHKIYQDKCFIFCARFTHEHRRVDLLLSIINSLDKDKFAFIIIGDGNFKPDFSNYRNVFDFGAVYDLELKNELFDIADVYFQPGWVGLSIVEAMAYGKPIFTFKRSEKVLQCVEYHYIENEINGLLFESIDDCINRINCISPDELFKLGKNAQEYVKEMLSMKKMVDNALLSLTKLNHKN